jgi:hypothetical protein
VNLREQAALDAKAILEDSVDGFGVPIVVTDPSGAQATVSGLSADIGHTIDPDTGQVVAARMASAAFSIATLSSAGFAELPRGVADVAAKPWVVTFDDAQGVAHTFKVKRSYPDRSVGIVTCSLEKYVA